MYSSITKINFYGLQLLSEKSKIVCEAGKKFKEYCNDCICSADGTDYACTKKTCNSTIYNKNGSFVKPYTCEPNTTLHQYCNLCVCPETGSELVCTTEACKDDTYEDGTFKNPNAGGYLGQCFIKLSEQKKNFYYDFRCV